MGRAPQPAVPARLGPFACGGEHYGSYNDAYEFNRRTVYVIDRTGKIAYFDLAYSVRDSVSFTKLKTALAAAK